MTALFDSVVPCVSEDHVPYNGGLSCVHAVLQRLLDSELKRVSDGVAKARAGKVKRRFLVNAPPHRPETANYAYLDTLGDDCAQQISQLLHPKRHYRLSADVVPAIVESRRELFGRYLITIED
jgi:hypothetical protein